MALKRIDFNSGQVMANGVKYFIEGELSIERYAELQIFQKEMSAEQSYQASFNKLNDLYQLINQQRFADCAVMVNDMIRGYAKVMQKEPTVLKICALFLNTEDEDRRIFSEDLVNKKIADWKAEGIYIGDFFTLASSSINGFLEIYQKVTRTISEKIDGLAADNR